MKNKTIGEIEQWISLGGKSLKDQDNFHISPMAVFVFSFVIVMLVLDVVQPGSF